MFTAAENHWQFALLVTLSEVEKKISETHTFLASSHRFDPNRPTHLIRLAELRTWRNSLSPNKDDLDKSIIHIAEVILLQFQSSYDVVNLLFQLANGFYSRSINYKQPEDVKYSVEYFRFLRVNFHPLQLEASDIPRGQLTLCLVQAMAHHLELEPWDNAMIQDLEEMATLTHELLSSDSSTRDLVDPIKIFCSAVNHKFTLEDIKLPSEQVIQVLRKAETIIPDLGVSYALALCITQRFLKAHVINDYEDAIDIADKIVAAHSPGDSLTLWQRKAIQLIKALVLSRSNSYSNPEYLEDAIHRFRYLLSLSSLLDQERTDLDGALNIYLKQRFDYFGGDSRQTYSLSQTYFLRDRTQPDGPLSDILKKVDHLEKIHIAMENGEITDIEEAVKRSRTILPLHSNHRLSYHPANYLAGIFLCAFRRTMRLDYLNEAIIAYRDIRKLSASKEILFNAGYWLIDSLLRRCIFLHTLQDFEEAMQLFPEVANDRSGEVFRRLAISCICACQARKHAHPSISTVYETAMSLI